MANLGLILLVFAFVIFCIATRVGTIGSMAAVPLGLAFWVASELIGGLGRVFH